MNEGRRTFLKASSAAMGLGFASGTAGAYTLPDPPRKARLKLSCQESRPPFETLAEKLDFLEEHGFSKAR